MGRDTTRDEDEDGDENLAFLPAPACSARAGAPEAGLKANAPEADSPPRLTQGKDMFCEIMTDPGGKDAALSVLWIAAIMATVAAALFHPMLLLLAVALAALAIGVGCAC